MASYQISGLAVRTNMKRRRNHHYCYLLATAAAMAHVAIARPQPIHTNVRFYGDKLAPGYQMRSWRMLWKEEAGGAGAEGQCLWFNLDWKAHPWAGVTFKQVEGVGVQLDRDWLDKGFVRFHLNGGKDRYGFLGGAVSLQVKPEVLKIRYQAVRSQFIDRARGIDQDTATWQEVLMPLSYWTELREGQVMSGVSVQCRGQPTRRFSLDEIGLVRFAEQPKWLTEKLSEKVAQPWVKWPAYDELPDLLKADRHPPKVKGGRFVWSDGQRVFLLNPYCREDARLDVWGTTQDDKRAPHHELYDPQQHGWLYQEVLTARALCRLGFNSYSATMPPEPWWRSVGFDRTDRAASAGRLPGFAKRVGLPFYVDTVAWPWTLGKPSTPEGNDLPADAFTQGRHHWTPYRITGRGREAWLSMWRLYAQRYRDAGVPALLFELMNEPAYVGLSDDHRSGFVEWLKERYRDLSQLNQTWRTELDSWEEAANLDGDGRLKKIPGRFFDYDEYLAGRFTALIAEGVNAVSEILPDTLVGLQTMGGYALRPRESVWKHLIAKHETVVLTPTGGGRWTQGHTCASAPADVLSCLIAPAPLENDLLLALAGDRMIFDNETYLHGQTAVEVRNRLWQHVVAGLDGLTVFSWSRRGWAWWRDRTKVQTEADKFPYCNLIPLARRTEALRGIHDFACEVQPLADRILPKPWGPKPAIALLHDWAQARYLSLKPDLPDKTAAYYAALKYTHWNVAVVPSDQAIAGALSDYEVLVVGGVHHIEPEMLPVLRAFVERGGVLIVGEEPFDRDVYDRKLLTAEQLGVEVGGPHQRQNAVARFQDTDVDAILPGSIQLTTGSRRLRVLAGTDVILTDDVGAPLLTRRNLGRGSVYLQAADLIGYPLAKLLWATLKDAASAKGSAGVPDHWRLAEIRDATNGQLAPNVLLSRRSHDTYHALLLMNRDEYRKNVVVQLPGLSGRWHVAEALSQRKLDGPGGAIWSGRHIAAGIPLSIEGGYPAVLLIEEAGDA